MAEKKLSFSDLSWRWGLKNFWRVLWKRWLAAWSTAISLSIGSFVCWKILGWEAMKAETLTWCAYALAPEGAVVILIFLWSFWIAPGAVAYEAAEAHALPPVPGLIDRGSRSMAGTIRQIGEVVCRPGFNGFRAHSTPGFQFNDIMHSAHVVWTRKDALQLRRDFENQIGRIAAANKENDAKERQRVAGELEGTISALTSILIGDS